MYALAASRARVLHVPRLSRHVVRLVFPAAESRATHSPSHRNTPSRPWCPAAPPLGPWWHAGIRSTPCRGRCRPSSQHSPAAPLNISSSSAASSPSARRRHVALATERRSAEELIHGRRGTALPRLYKEPELVSARRRPQAISLGPSLVAKRPGEAFFPESGWFGRRQAPAESIATSASPSRLSPPRTLPSSRKHNPSLNFGRRPPQPKHHFVPEAPSAEELAAGDSLHLRRPCDHRKDRLGVADPSVLLDAREKTSFAGDDRRMPRLCSGREEEGVGTGQT